MTHRASILVLVLVVALMAASGASAKRMHVRSNVHTSHYSLVKAGNHSVAQWSLRRSHRVD
jgi:hypothetical protein